MPTSTLIREDEARVVTIREAARRLACNRQWLAGVIAGRGLDPRPVGSSLQLTESEYRRLERWIKRHRRRKADPP